MKKLLLAITLTLALAVTANAQDVGQIWVGGSLGIETSKTGDYDRINNYNITPELGYVLNSDLAIGMRIGYKHAEEAYKSYNDEDYSLGFVYGKEKYDGFEVNPFIRYTFLKGDIGGLFLDGGVGYAYLKNKATDVKTNTYEVGIRPGVALALSEKVVLTGRFGHLGYTHSKAGSEKSDKFEFNLKMNNILLGVNVIF